MARRWSEHVEGPYPGTGDMQTHGMKVIVVGVIAGQSLNVGRAPAVGQSSSEKPTATEVGVTPDRDPHRGRRPTSRTRLCWSVPRVGRTGSKAAANYVNSKAAGGGVAGRKLVVDFIDSI